MLEDVSLTKTISKKEYKETIEPLKAKLSMLQHEVKNSGLPVMILFEGWGAAGKGSVLSDVILTLDPRNFKTISTLPPTVEEKRKPFMWRHWNHIPSKGYFSIFDRSWYPEVISDRVENGVSKKISNARLDSINLFERQLSDDGMLIIKFFIHISKKEQKLRLDRLADKKSTSWRATKQDYARNKMYEELYNAYDLMLPYTHTAQNPWHLVSGTDKRSALADIYTILVNSIETALANKKAKEENSVSSSVPSNDNQPANAPLSAGAFSLVHMPTLSEVNLERTMEKEAYKAQLVLLQDKLKKLHNKIYLHKIPVIIAYEGWDAAGKGGNIKRLTSALDPRGYEVIPIAAPTPTEKEKHYLWRFWTQLPKNGHVALYDRTWYGRVMVERIEGFAKDEEWRRAYQEINEFESQLTSWGAIVLKFWLQISKDEQLNRFEARQNTPEKQWKITEEDWRNREKWGLYETAVNDMLRLTSTESAPWTIIESNDKYFARIKTIETVINAIEARL